MNPTIWTPQLVERLRQLWPTHSARQISETFANDGIAISRCAVIGKSQRLELSEKLFTKVPKEEQNRKKRISDARYRGTLAVKTKKAAITQRFTGRLPKARARRLEPMSKAEMRAMFAQAVLNTQAIHNS